MKIFHIYKDYFPVLGGIENHIKVLAEAQVSAGHQVTVLACNPGYNTSTRTLNGVTVVKAGRLATFASMPISFSQPLILAGAQPDIIHLHSPYPLGETSALFLGKARATLMTYHADVFKQKRLLLLYSPLLKKVLHFVDGIIATSPSYIETSPWLNPVKEKCAVVPLGVDHHRFTPQENQSESQKILFVGRHRYYKNLTTLLNAMTELPRAQLEVLGDGPMRRIWEQESRDLGLTDRVHFTGEVDDDELPRKYQQAGIFVLPANSRAEAFGTVILEAMASGLPCISTELGTGTSWIVKDRVTGFVVPPEDPDLLAQALSPLLRSLDLRRQFGEAGRRRVEDNFTQEKMVAGVEEQYDQVLKGKRPVV